MAREITIAKFKDVANGLQPGQFSIGERENVSGLDGLDPICNDLLDRPITINLGLIEPDGRVGLSQMWFDYEGDYVLVDTAAQRRKCGWIWDNPRLTILIVNPDNPYHWVQIKCTVEHEELERAPTAIGLRSSWIKSGRSTRVTNHLTGYETRALARRGCSSYAKLTASRPSESVEPPHC